MRWLLLFAVSGLALAQVPVISTSATALQESQTATVSCTANCTSLTWKVNGVTGGNSTIGTITTGTSVTYTAPASTTANQELYGCPIGFNDSIWNTPAAGLPLIANWRGNSFLNNAWYHFFVSLPDTPNNGKVSISPSTVLHVNSNIGMSYADATTPTADFINNYDNTLIIRGFPFPLWPAHYREGGTYDFSANNDHHTLVMRTDTCNMKELYNEQLQLITCGTGPNCYGTSGMGVINSNAYSWVGGTDAGGGMLAPYTLHISEVKAGVVKHALHGRLPGLNNSNFNNLMWPATYGAGSCNAKDIVGWTITNGGSGYSPSTTVTVSGGGQPNIASKFTPVISGGVITGLNMIHSSFNGSLCPSTGWCGYTSAPNFNVADSGGGTGAAITATIDYPCPPMGSRIVLQSSYLTAHTGAAGACPAGSNCLNGAGLVVATALNQYGMIDLDNNSNTFTVDAGPDLYQDITAYNQIQGQIATIPFSAFDFYDQSKLAISTLQGINNQTGCSGGPCGQSQVQPDNDLGITVPGSVWITATNSSGQSKSVDINLVPPTIGTYDEVIYVLAGNYTGSRGTSGGIQLPAWVNGTGSPSLTWSCSSCAGSITTAGIYTPPTSLSTTGTVDTAVATLTSDTNVTKSIYIRLLPNAGNFLTDTIRVDAAISTTAQTGPDGNGRYWLGNVGAKIGDVNSTTDSTQWSTNPAENTQLSTAYYSTSADDHHYKFYLPNGNYRVRILSGWIGTSVISATSWNHMPVNGLVTDRGVGTFKLLHWNMMEQAGRTYAGASNSDMIMSATVTNNILEIDNSNDFPSPSGWPSCNSHGGTCQSWPETSGIEVLPDTTTAHWEIGVTNGVPPSNVSTWVSNKVTVAPSGKINLFLRDWYTGLSDAQWSILSGPGSLVTSNTQLSPTQFVPIATYTAPVTQPPAGTGVVIQAQSASNPSVSAIIAIPISSPGGPSTGAGYFK